MNYDWLLSKSRWLWAFFLYVSTKNGSVEITYKSASGEDFDQEAAGAALLKEIIPAPVRRS